MSSASSCPLLRERRAAIGPLVNRFAAEFSRSKNVDIACVTADALRFLEAYDWPGNIRELRNVLERAISLSQGNEIKPADEADMLRIIDALKKYDNNRLRTAEYLGMS